MPKFFREPLFHFLLFGILIFILYAFVNQGEAGENDIVIDDGRMEHIIALHQLEYKKPPSEDELLALIESNIRQEIFYREALRLHLDENDDVVKGRLAQKMEFLNNDLTAIDSEPDTEELAAFYSQNKEKYKTKPTYTFYQIGFSKNNETNAREAAINVLKEANNIPVENMRDKGGNLPLSFSYSGMTAEALGYELGTDMAEKLDKAPLKQWFGPIETKYGEHLFFLVDRLEPTFPELESIEKKVANDFAAEKEKEVQNAMYQELKSQYKIQVETNELDAAMKKRILETVN
ncbi:peptidyl-prolyl cis-trans isomerase [Cryomorpha ignava]|uniref:Peptidyl-prolyl cis-trans isomerase n=1 Tax=Cryomorpha ignava TaxID=101383 RepID=A0A7K3WT53_9FLAO|nr:peptidylprolyl isomerase [Cryomorpha ignava]NEN24231.1 peptidyl-prolyl cis-trans isomerase [Cryomorpha ignava]